MLMTKKLYMKVLILCTGNSCRSQMAHGFLQSFDSNITVFSAGTEASGKLNRNAVEAMAEAADMISVGDQLHVKIRTDNIWSLLPNYGICSSIAPCLIT